MGKSPSRKVTILPSLVAIGTTYIVFSLSSDLAGLRDQRVARLYRQETMKVGYNSVRFGCHRHTVTCLMSSAPNVMTSSAPAWLVSFKSNPVDAPAWSHRSYRNGDINSYIKSYMDTMESWTRLLDPPYCEMFKIGNIDLQFRSPGYGWQKNNKKKNKNNCKVFYFLRKRNNITKPCLYGLKTWKNY